MEKFEHSAEKADPEKMIGQVFVEFLKTSQGEYRLESFIRKIQAVDKSALVSEVYRNGGAHTLYWTDNRETNPHRYWLVQSGGVNYLLPKPLLKDRFEDLEGLNIEGGMAPDKVSEFTPVKVKRIGSNWELVNTISSDDKNNTQTTSTSFPTRSMSVVKEEKQENFEEDKKRLEEIKRQIQILSEEARKIESRLSKRG